MGRMGLTLIEWCWFLILNSGASGFIWKLGVENYRVGLFGKLRRARRVVRRFTKVPLRSPLISNICCVCFVTFGEMPERATPSSPIGVGDSPNGPEHCRPVLILEFFCAGIARTNLDDSGMPSRKRTRGIVETSQDISTTDVGVVAHQIGCSYVSKDLIRPLLGIASNVEPQKTISRFKLSYISGMWRSLCECITEFSVESTENLKELEAGVALILKVLREVNIVNLSPLEVLLEDSFKNHRDNPCCRAVHFSKDNKGFSSRVSFCCTTMS
uniref:Uncharacterized protein n=1 Tax=Solanum tuberosum TaxID=4113 RepID=M1DCN4_SOLTU